VAAFINSGMDKRSIWIEYISNYLQSIFKRDPIPANHKNRVVGIALNLPMREYALADMIEYSELVH
jgi:hypothetical protein